MSAADHPTRRASAARPSARAFPGGRPRLPLLTREGDGDGPEVHVVRSAFLGGVNEQPEVHTAGFQDYFTVESLFDPVAEDEESPLNAWEVLGLSPTKDWAVVARHHRKLVKSFHPDRFVDADEHQRRWAEDSIRRLNQAFSVLRTQFQNSQPPENPD